MQIITALVVISILSCSMVKAGFLGSQFAYRSGFRHPTPFASTFGAPYAAPLPVAPLSAHDPFGAVSYATQPGVKIHGFGPFTTYATIRSHHKFAFPAPAPSIYNAPPPVSYGPPEVAYSGFPEPNTVVKFGPPITTTTTTYTTTAAAQVAPVAVPSHYNGVAGW